MRASSNRKLAEALGVSETAVRKALTAGRISRESGGGFDIAKVKRQWAGNTDAAQQRPTAQAGERADILCDYLRAALLSSPQLIDDEATAVDAMLVLTARSDSFPELQKARRFDGLDARCEDIRSVSMHRLAEAIERPADRYGMQMGPDLVDAMIDDAPTTDALPLFAFALERLWQQFHQEGHIHKTHYESVERLDGLIEYAAERALRDIRPGEDRPIDSKISPRRDQRAARTFVPALAQVNEKGEPIRRVAPRARFDDEAQEILDPFIQWRLVISKRSPNDAGSTVEIDVDEDGGGGSDAGGMLGPASRA